MLKNPYKKSLVTRILFYLRQLKLWSFGWRFVFAVSLLFSVLLGTDFLSFVFKSIRAEKNQTETIKFFVETVELPEVTQDPGSGWWGEENMIANPELGPEAEVEEFDNTNSVFYSGGNYSVVLKDFELLKIEEKEALELENFEIENFEELLSGYEDVDVIIASGTEGFVSTSSDYHVSTSTDLFLASSSNEFASSVEEMLEEIQEKYASSTESEETDSYVFKSEEDFATSTYEVVENMSTGTEVIIEEMEVSEEEEIVVEIVSPDFEGDIEEGGVEVEGEAEGSDFGNVGSLETGFYQSQSSLQDDNGGEEVQEGGDEDVVSEATGSYRSADDPLQDDDEGELSFLNRVFGSSPVFAEEFVGEVPEDLEELGEFLEARLMFSMAIRKKQVTSGGDEVQKSGDEGVVFEETGSYQSQDSFQDDIVEEEEPGLIGSLIEKILPEDKPEVIEIDSEEQEVEITSEFEEPIVEEEATEELGWLDYFVNQASAQGGSPKFNIWYLLEEGNDEAGELWQKLDYLTEDEMDNFSNNGYYSVELEAVESWKDIERLQIKLEGLVEEHEDWLVYIDSSWVEVDYNKETELEKISKRERYAEALEFLSEQTSFSLDEEGELRFQYVKNEEYIWETLGEMIGLGNFWQDVNLEVQLVGTKNEELDIPLTILFEEDGEFVVRLPEAHSLNPGNYKLKFFITDRSGDEEEYFEITQDFSWGVLAMNFDKSEYLPDETAYVQLAVLDESGHTICDAELDVVIVGDGGQETYSTASIDPAYKIAVSDQCGPDTVTQVPDYYFFYQFGGRGEYEFRITAHTENGEYKQSEIIEVNTRGSLIVSRESATRIWPKANYEMAIEIKSENGFKGDIVETVPGEFKVLNNVEQITNNEEADPYGSNYKYFEIVDEDKGVKDLVWRDVEIPAGETLELRYTYDAPDISPEFYLVGPLDVDGIGERDYGIKYQEKRSWQIASDAMNKRARTVMFSAGVYNGDGTTGLNTNTDQSFSAFNWRLAETGVDIRNAFVIFEAQFEAYDDSGGDYNGYNMSFDACEESCTASAWGTGAGQVSVNNSNILAYDEGESNQVRLLFDVTSETQMANYSGDNVEIESQFGYHIKNGTTRNSIANARAILVVTYAYDASSENITNTVVYPLDSDNGTDQGTRQASQAGCTADTDCPTFSYQMEIPEWSGVATSTNRLSQWFKFFDHNDSNNANNLDPYLDIEGYDVDSSANHYECNNGGTQGNMPGMIWEDWSSSGYAENEAQQVEYYINTGNNYMIGGEVFETYIASSSASEKTRTVSFPIGVITNGNTTAENTGEVYVYFPENGSGSGNVDIKSAWFRVKTHNYNSATLNTQISTTIGTNATTSALTYSYNGGGSVIKPLIDIIHIIPTADYTALEAANANTGVVAKINVTNSATTYDGVSAELMITYTYTDESEGYNTSLSLFGGQSSGSPTTSVTPTAANSVAPESGNKIVYAGGLLASFLNSDSSGAVGAGSVFLLDASIATDTPSCSGAYRAQPDAVNMYTEMYADVSQEITTEDDDSYSACYVDDDTPSATDGAKMNGILTYTYGWTNSAPTSSLLAIEQKRDDSGVVDFSIEVDDSDGHDVRLKLEYESGTACTFGGEPVDPTLDETDSSITADHLDPYIENDNVYQIGTDSGYVHTASGSNTVHFDWLAETELGQVDSSYCFRLTANDQFLDQAVPATSTVYIDTLEPTQPGSLSLDSRTGNSITFNLGATTTENNFLEYIVYYKIFDGTDPVESDSVHSSSSDINLDNILFNDASTTTISGLVASTTYSFSIWAYDDYGNSSSSARVDITTNDAPTGVFNEVNTKQRVDASGIVDVEVEIDDANNHDTLKAKLEYVEGGVCDFSTPLDPTLDESQSNITADFGAPTIENDNEYQVGQAGTWILTAPGSNTVTFDWLAQTDLPTGDAEYCLRLTVNDRFDDQLQLATTSLIIDNVAPTSTGALTAGSLEVDSITLVYATSTPGEDTNEPTANAYKIFYKQGVSGVTESDIEIDNANLDAYDYNSATSVKISGLDENTWYVFNIWTYDAFGNSSSSQEIAIKTNASINIDSFEFLNALSDGPDSNIVLAGDGYEWTLRMVVTDVDGWYAISSTTVHLADDNDSTSPFYDIAFKWNQSSDTFLEIGTDNEDAVTMTGSSTCAGLTCTLDFKLNITKTFFSPSTNYSAEVFADVDSGLLIHESYTDFYQVRFPWVAQKHYRFRNDDGGE